MVKPKCGYVNDKLTKNDLIFVTKTLVLGLDQLLFVFR